MLVMRVLRRRIEGATGKCTDLKVFMSDLSQASYDETNITRQHFKT